MDFDMSGYCLAEDYVGLSASLLCSHKLFYMEGDEKRFDQCYLGEETRKNEIELVINNESARFIALCIIFYNASLLSSLYEFCLENNMTEECRKIIKLSPVAWQHISLVGKYEFNRDGYDIINLTEIVRNFTKNLKEFLE
jgi:hypothetical protein